MLRVAGSMVSKLTIGIGEVLDAEAWGLFYGLKLVLTSSLGIGLAI